MPRTERQADAAVHRGEPEEPGFHESCRELAALYSRYHARDVYMSLLVSELWPGNVASQVKHVLAVRVFASLPIARFTPARRIASYDDFCQFISEVHGLLPSFPAVEDFSPPGDWGEIRQVWGDEVLKTFYGGMTERITDFVQAFRMLHSADAPAMQDMQCALQLQDRLLSLVDAPPTAADDANADRALTLPGQAFWEQCLAAMPTLAELAQTIPSSAPLTLTLGTLKKVANRRTIERGTMTGRVLPFLWINIQGERLPVAPRDAASTVMTFWEKRALLSPAQAEVRTASALVPFLRNRVRHAIAGRYRIRLRERARSLIEVAGFLTHGTSMWVIAVMSRERLAELARIERALHASVHEHQGLIALDLSANDLFVLRPGASDTAENFQVTLIAVIADAVLSNAMLWLPRSTARVFFLADFLSLLESITGADDLEGFFEFLDTHPQAQHTPFVGPMDLFAMFRHSHGMMIDGVVQPHMIFVDPHAGARWRFDAQKAFWAGVPARFPDDDPTAWTLTPSLGSSHLVQLIHKARWHMSWTAALATTSAHFLLDAAAQPLSEREGTLLEVFVHCLADSLTQRAAWVPASVLPACIVTQCFARGGTDLDGDPEGTALLTGWHVTSHTDRRVVVRVEVELARVRAGLKDAKDATFEAQALLAWLTGLAPLIGVSLETVDRPAIEASGARQPRFFHSETQRKVDVPDRATPKLPLPRQYKAARRGLAHVFEQLGSAPGRYELAPAKALLDPARNALRDLVHAQMARFAREPLLMFAQAQYDALIAQYDANHHRIRMSLAHEVDFDRPADLAEAHETFVAHARNYRYLLECVYSSIEAGQEIPTESAVTDLIAAVDWLMVLYTASDTLHHGIDVGGLSLSHDFVPEVFYDSEDNGDYARELAEERLGSGSADDTLSRPSAEELARLDDALVRDAGFALDDLWHTLTILARWAAVHDRPDDLHLSYRAWPADIVAAVERCAAGEVDAAAVGRAVEFLCLRADRVRSLSDRTAPEGDVPVWEHRKRDHRYTIRPLLRLTSGELLWGAAAAHRAHGIWAGSLSEGFLPADLPWPHVAAESERIKDRSEVELEQRALDICRRHAVYVDGGVDLMKRFPKEGFEDVGDFDVLAYFPARHTLVAVECKYNKPAFCLKDMRRLRDYIFGKKTPEGSHVGKMQTRRHFLEQHAQRVLSLMRWPAPVADTPLEIVDLYVCPRIFHWMRSPPYPTPVHFVRLNMLEAWLTSWRSGQTERA